MPLPPPPLPLPTPPLNVASPYILFTASAAGFDSLIVIKPSGHPSFVWDVKRPIWINTWKQIDNMFECQKSYSKPRCAGFPFQNVFFSHFCVCFCCFNLIISKHWCILCLFDRVSVCVCRKWEGRLAIEMDQSSFHFWVNTHIEFVNIYLGIFPNAIEKWVRL